MQELDINDYPASVRKKVMHKSTFDDIIERTGVYIVCRGSYLAPNKKPEPGEKRLHLVLESDNEMSVRQARMDLLRMLEEETIKLSAQPGIGGGGGRYSVV
ncbi:hypothetical protein EON65_17165 [archaeon]|nr:MAG: hypothetical protein EON65_17165 [archaeon]